MKIPKLLSRRNFAKIACTALAVSMLCLGSGCSSKEPEKAPAADDTPKTVVFTDSLGREVEVPSNVEIVIPSGHTANQVLLTLCPEKMGSTSSELSEEELHFFTTEGLADLPVTGAAFGAKGDLNKEAVASIGDPSTMVLVDTGEPKDGMKEDLDTLQQQLGIPCVFIETQLDDWSSAYLALGELLGCEERAQVLADYCKNTYDEVTAVMNEVGDQRVKLAYIVGDEGVNAIAKDSYQGGVVDMVADNVVVVEKASGKGTGNEIDLEQLNIWNPEMIVFQSATMYDNVASASNWQSLSAIQNGQYFAVPNSPYCWLNNPPTVNQVLGMQWLPRVLYADKFDTSIEEVTKDYYKTFYQYDLSDAELQELLANANIK